MADIELILGADNGHSPADKLSQAYPKINRNFTELNDELAQEEVARAAADTAHANSGNAHPAENVTYDGEVSAATNVKQAVDGLKITLDQAILGAGDSGPEVTAARFNTGSGEIFPTLKDRLDAEWAETAKIILSDTQPVTGDENTYWYEDMGETPDPGGGAGLVIANAGTDGSQPIQFDLLPEGDS